MNEWIVRFHRGVTEPEARAVIGELGGQVRRRMRWDHADEVLLLAHFAEAASSPMNALQKHARVAQVEANDTNYVPMQDADADADVD